MAGVSIACIIKNGPQKEAEALEIRADRVAIGGSSNSEAVAHARIEAGRALIGYSEEFRGAVADRQGTAIGIRDMGDRGIQIDVLRQRVGQSK